MRGRYIEMIQDRQVRVTVLAGNASVKPGAGSDQLFQVTMLRALLLPPRCRDVFVLTEMQGYTMPEVAKVLGISKDSVEKHLRRALREMQIS
jgi:DNA-directed RNA polymerase specialized sigma24 family protein